MKIKKKKRKDLFISLFLYLCSSNTVCDNYHPENQLEIKHPRSFVFRAIKKIFLPFGKGGGGGKWMEI